MVHSLPSLSSHVSCQFKHFDSVKDAIDHYYENETCQVHLWKGILFLSLLRRVVIVRAAGTPYQNGFFLFDIHFPFQYPDGPPISTLLQLYDLKLKLLSKFCLDIQYGNI